MNEIPDLINVDKIPLILKGIGNFGNGSVCFVQVENHSFLKNIADKIFQLLRKKLLVMGTSGFEPHVTLMKMRSGGKDAKIMNQAVELTDETTFFGVEVCTSIDLCAMEEVDDDGFYKIVHSITLNKNA
jgi:2'-5' RNA ligase